MQVSRTAAVLLVLSAALAGGAPVTHAAATPPPAHELTMEEAVKRVEQQYRARVVKAEALKSGTHATYVLKLLDESGKVWTVHVDAATGAVN